MPPYGSLYGVVFPSQLGWMAVLGQDETLLALSFDHPSPQSAIASVQKSSGLAAESWESPTEGRHSFVDTLVAYACGEWSDLSLLEIDPGPVTPFQRHVLEACRAIPYGQTRNYADLAAAAGSPGAARAVGNVMATNRLPLVVPCHRVVASGGRLGGYSAPGGLEVKRRLLALERAAADRLAPVSG